MRGVLIGLQTCCSCHLPCSLPTPCKFARNPYANFHASYSKFILGIGGLCFARDRPTTRSLRQGLHRVLRDIGLGRSSMIEILRFPSTICQYTGGIACVPLTHSTKNDAARVPGVQPKQTWESITQEQSNTSPLKLALLQCFTCCPFPSLPGDDGLSVAALLSWSRRCHVMK